MIEVCRMGICECFTCFARLSGVFTSLGDWSLFAKKRAGERERSQNDSWGEAKMASKQTASRIW